MAIPTVSITGHVLSPSGTAFTSGRVEAKLSAPGSALDGAVSERVAMTTQVTLGAGGAIALALVPNAAITPSGTYYRVRFAVADANGVPREWEERWQLASAPSTIDIGAVPRIDAVPGVAVSLTLTFPGYTTATRPTPDATWHRRPICVKDPGVGEELQVALQDSAGGYEWITIGYTSS